MYQAALKAYDSVNKSTMSGRDVEAEVLTKAALKLKACQDNVDAKWPRCQSRCGTEIQPARVVHFSG